MPRNPIGKQAMTDAERQARRRRKLQQKADAALTRRERLRKREQNAKDFQPMPPGITYWRRVTLRVDRDAEVWQPLTRPLPACDNALEDDEVVTLIRQLHRVAYERGITIPEPDTDNPTHASLLQAKHVQPAAPGEMVTIGPRP
jgi:hypothetical protein